MGVSDLVSRALRSRLFLIGGGIVAILVLVGLFASSIAPYDPLQQHLTERLLPPNSNFLLGTDWAGRDTLSRLIYGTRITLTIAFSVVTLAGVTGVFMGVLGGFVGGPVDALFAASSNVLFTFPSLVLALAIAALLGVSTSNMILALAIVYTPTMARITRAAVLSIKNMDYILAARALGGPTPRILFSHVLPNVMAPVIVQLTVGFSWCILAEASLTYLGFGAQPPDASWGMVLNEGRRNFLTTVWPSLFAGIFIGLATVGYNFLGDGLRDILDPTLRELR